MSRHKPDRRRQPRRVPASPHAVHARVEALTARGIQYASQGNLADAAAQFLEAVRLQPRLHYLHGNLGSILQMLGDAASAADHYRQALDLEPEDAQTRSNLAVLLHKQGRSEEAIDHLRRALSIRPDYHDALNNLGNVLQDSGDLEGARECYARALQVDSRSAAALRGMGNVALRRQCYEDAVRFYEMVEAVEPGNIDVYRVLASALVGAGRWEDGLDILRHTLRDVSEVPRTHLLAAIDGFQEQQFDGALDRVGEALTPLLASPLDPGREAMAEALGIFSRVVLRNGKPVEHERILRLIIALQPDHARTHLELGIVLQWMQREDEAILEYALALKTDPLLPSAWSNLSRAYLERGRLDEARASLERALEIDPASSIAHSSLIFVGDLDARCTCEQAMAERVRWRERHAAPLSVRVGPYLNSPVPDRRLRVGYVSGDLRHHSAASCLAGVLCHHDPRQVEMVCYSTHEGAPDSWTERFRTASTLWRDVAHLSDEAVCEMVRGDAIDILVDLAGHSAGNRLLVFARKPAPVQVSAWGYATGTGLDTMDYLFSDEICAPPHTQRFYAEKLWYLPCALSYEPPGDDAVVAPLPAAGGQGVTFGCLNRLVRISSEALRVWAEVLHACAGSRLLLKAGGFSSPEAVQGVRRQVEAWGVDPARLVLEGPTGQREHLATFDRIDLALDPFPHGGGITTLEGLWRGVPAVTLLGNGGPETRITSSIMTVLDLEAFVARSLEEYVDVALRHAQDLQGLAAIRLGLRHRVLESPLLGGVSYCRAVEAAYREMWRAWCRTQAGTTS